MQRKGLPALSDLSEFPREKRTCQFYIDSSGSQLEIECDSPCRPRQCKGCVLFFTSAEIFRHCSKLRVTDWCNTTVMHIVNQCICRYTAPCPDLGDRRAAAPLAECSRLWLINCETVALWDADTALERSGSVTEAASAPPKEKRLFFDSSFLTFGRANNGTVYSCQPYTEAFLLRFTSQYKERYNKRL
ncbi:hypothetical protein MHYP_G00110530 [Metynnis hypsauchen]